MSWALALASTQWSPCSASWRSSTTCLTNSASLCILTYMTSPTDIRTGVAAYNAEYLAGATEAEKVEFAQALEHGVPTLSVSLDPIRNGHSYRTAATFGLMFDGGFYAAEEPKVRTLRMFDGRRSPFFYARQVFGGSKLTEGVELRMLRHGSGAPTIETDPAR